MLGRVYLEAPVAPVIREAVEPGVVLQETKEAGTDHGRHISHKGTHRWLLKEHTRHVSETKGRRALEVDHTRTENEGEQPEDDDQQDLDHGDQHEEHNIDWD